VHLGLHGVRFVSMVVAIVCILNSCLKVGLRCDGQSNQASAHGEGGVLTGARASPMTLF